jgi:Kelch motif
MLAGLLAAAVGIAGSWQSGAPLPTKRTEVAGAALRGEVVVVGGVRRAGELARVAYALDLSHGRWARIAAPVSREHLAVAAFGGRVYAAAGRTAGIDTNLDVFESYTPGARAWRRLAPVPEPRGGTGVAASCGRLISVGGEAPSGTIGSVYSFSPSTGRWTRLPDLPTPRHGLAVVGVGRRIFAVAGGPEPGLRVSDANESLDLC